MTRRVSQFAIGLLVLGVVIGSGGDGRAGVPSSASEPFCTITPGTSFCFGNFAGFQQSSDPNATAGFDLNSGGGYFTASLNGQTYACNISTTLYPSVAAMWPQAVLYRNGYFFIGWDPQGNCSTLTLFNGSNY